MSIDPLDANEVDANEVRGSAIERRGDPAGDPSLLLPVGGLLDGRRTVDHPLLADGRVRYRGDAPDADGGGDA